MDRNKIIIKVSIQGILVNVALVILKSMIGLMSHSIAILLDAVNNLSDALSQIITVVAAKLSAKAPDKKHPYGYGRIEYLSAIIIAALILTAGAISVRESIDKIFHPMDTHYSFVSIAIIAIAIVVKFFLGRYVTKTGEDISSQSLVASGKEATMDSFLSLSTLVAALINVLFHLNLEGFLGVIISLFIMKAGFDALRETLSSLIGDRYDSELTREMKTKIYQHDGVCGVYDLILHDYGPSRSIGSVHVEVDDQMSASKIHKLSRRISDDIRTEYGIILTVGVYASNTSNPEVMKMKREVAHIIHSYEHILSFHGFYVDREYHQILFDIVVSFREKHPMKLMERVKKEVQEQYPDYSVDIIIDYDFTD